MCYEPYIIPILQIRKLELQEIKDFAQDHGMTKLCGIQTLAIVFKARAINLYSRNSVWQRPWACGQIQFNARNATTEI